MSTKTEIIGIEGILSPVVFAAPSAITTRDELLLASKVVLTVTDHASAEQAVDILRQLKEFSDKVEDGRKEVKAPVDLVVKQIQDTARTLTQTIEVERGRIDRMLGDWNRQQQEIAQRQRDAALAEEQRLIDEANQKLADAAKAGASDKKLDKIEQKAFEQIAVAKANVAAAVAPKFAGIATRGVWEYEVTDFPALYAAHPTAVKMEPVDAIVKALLKQTKGVLPGVTASFVNRTSVR